jgi:hypothetical protein
MKSKDIDEIKRLNFDERGNNSWKRMSNQNAICDSPYGNKEVCKMWQTDRKEKVGLLDVEYFIKIVGGGNGGHPYVSF